MKATIIITVLLAISFCRLTAQNIEPAQQPVNYCGNPNYLIQSTLPEFTQDTVYQGFMWGSKHVISAMVYANQAHIFGSDDFIHLYNTPNLITMSNDFGNPYCRRALNTDHGKGDGILLARALHFDPALNLSQLLNSPYQVDYYKIARQCNSENNFNSLRINIPQLCCSIRNLISYSIDIAQLRCSTYSQNCTSTLFNHVVMPY